MSPLEKVRRLQMAIKLITTFNLIIADKIDKIADHSDDGAEECARRARDVGDQIAKALQYLNEDKLDLRVHELGGDEPVAAELKSTFLGLCATLAARRTWMCEDAGQDSEGIPNLRNYTAMAKLMRRVAPEVEQATATSPDAARRAIEEEGKKRFKWGTVDVWIPRQGAARRGCWGTKTTGLARGRNEARLLFAKPLTAWL